MRLDALQARRLNIQSEVSTKISGDELHLVGRRMRKRLLPALATLVVALMWAGTKPVVGKIVSEASVNCGTEAHGHKGKEKLDLVCQEYVIRTATSDYHIRQPKQHDQSLLPLNSAINFTLDKDKMKFKLNGKKYEFLVVSETSVGSKP